MYRKEGWSTVALFRCDENFCGSFDNSISIEALGVPARAGDTRLKLVTSGVACTYPQVGASTGTNRVTVPATAWENRTR
jgi:hypothetical protein